MFLLQEIASSDVILAGTIFGTVSVVCLVGGSVNHFSRNGNGKFVSIPTKTFVHVAVAENIWQQCSELVDNLALMRRLLTGSQKMKTSLNLKLLLGRVLAAQAENRFQIIFAETARTETEPSQRGFLR